MISFLSLLIKKKSRRSPSSWEGRLKAGDNLGSSVQGEGGQRWWFWLSSFRPHGKEDQLRNVYRLLLSNSSPHEEVITIYVQSLDLGWPGKMNWLSPLKQEGKSSSSSLAPTADKRAVRTLSSMLETDIGATLRLYLEDLDHFRDGTNIQCQEGRMAASWRTTLPSVSAWTAPENTTGQ